MKAISSSERRIGYGILLLLAAVAGTILHLQRAFNPAVTAAHRAAELASLGGPPSEADLLALDGCTPAGAGETFDAGTLADKIDGRAELYLAAGFERLQARRFLGAGTSSWFEVHFYTMANPEAAFAVFSGQRREGAESVPLGDEAYRTENALFLVIGRHYAELIGSGREDAEVMATAARALVAGLPEEAVAAQQDARKLLPPGDQVAGSLELLTEDAFGFDGFDEVYVARYRNARGEGSLYVTARANAEEAGRLAQAYVGFLRENGALEADPAGDGDPAVFEVFGRYETVLASGKVVAGVRDAPATDWARAMQSALLRSVMAAEEGAP